ncbi:helix-turn-helix domain-containing protein [Candidatus Foliamicus sp.]
MFEEALRDWEGGCLTQDQAAALLGVSVRTFRRWTVRYGEDGIEGLRDRRVSRASGRAAPVDEVMRMVDRYRTRHAGWNMRHYYAWYRRAGAQRSYTWVRNKLQEHGAVVKGRGRGKHRRKRAPAPWPGVMLHQDGSTHEWVSGKTWDLIVTMDDATNEHYSMFFCEEEGMGSSCAGVRVTVPL